MTKKKKNDEFSTPIDDLLYSFVDIARMTWKARQTAIENRMLKPLLAIDANSNIQPVEINLGDVDLTGAQDVMRMVLIDVLRETGMIPECAAVMNAEGKK